METHRIFIAINLPAKVKQELLGYKEKWPELPARWTKPENLHVTLVFLGNTSEQEVREVKKIASQVAARHNPFSFSLSKIMYGPSLKQPRMLWAVGKMPKELSSLQEDLAGALGHHEEYLFSLHITLARLNEWGFRGIEPEERPQIDEKLSLEVPVSSFEIMESRLKRGGAEYTLVEQLPLSLAR